MPSTEDVLNSDDCRPVISRRALDESGRVHDEDSRGNLPSLGGTE